MGFLKNRKGIALENFGSYALAFGVAVIIVSVTAQILGQIYTTQASCTTGTTANYNYESITFTTNNTEYGTIYKPICSGSLYLGSNSTFPLGSAYYAVSSTGIKIYANGTTAGACWPNITAGCTYYANYNARIEEIENITTKGLTGTKNLGDWLPTIATIIAAVIVIMLIVSGFGGFRGGFEGFST